MSTNEAKAAVDREASTPGQRAMSGTRSACGEESRKNKRQK